MKMTPDLSGDSLSGVQVTPGTAVVTGGDVPHVDRVVAGMRGAFRACYRRGLAVNAEQRGKLHIVATLGPLGEVVRATAQRAGSLDEDTTECVLRRVRNATFSPPSGSDVSVNVEVFFGSKPSENP